MDARNDLIVAAVKDYSWEALKCFSVSLSRSGFRGKKLLFTHNIDSRAKGQLTNLGFTILDFTPEDAGLGGFPSARYAPLYRYLSDNPDIFRYVIWVDAGDLVFQSDPSVWLENNIGDKQLIVCSEGVKLKNEPTNLMWTTDASNGLYVSSPEDEQLCSGTIAGTARAMTLLTQAIFLKSSKINEWRYGNGGFGSDQGMLNYLSSTVPFKEITKVVKADEAFALQANWFILRPYYAAGLHTSTDPVFDTINGLAYTVDDKLYSIVHQYNRDGSSWMGNFKAAVEGRYQ